jgi:hypothetical protein
VKRRNGTQTVCLTRCSLHSCWPAPCSKPLYIRCRPAALHALLSPLPNYPNVIMNRNVTVQSILNRLRMRRTLVQLSIFVLCLFTLVALGFGAQAWTGRQLFDDGFESVRQLVGQPKPPLYEAWHAKELALPQHNASLPFPEGASGRYLYVGNRMIGESSI